MSEFTVLSRGAEIRNGEASRRADAHVSRITGAELHRVAENFARLMARRDHDRQGADGSAAAA